MKGRYRNMFLYNIVLGNLNLTPESWSHITDEHGNHFIAKDDIRQRIRIDGKVDQSLYPELGELTPVWSSANMQCYDILPGTKWVNNNRNMNPLLLSNNRENSEGKEQVVIYITVSNNYSIVRFTTQHKILQTYHKTDMYQGCAVVLDSNDVTAGGNIIRISVLNKKNNVYTDFNIFFTKEDTSKILVNRKNITNPKVLETLKSQVEKFKNRYMGFKILTKPNELLTSTYITSEKFKDDVVNATKNIKNPKIIVVNPEQLETTESVQSVMDMLRTEFDGGKIKAITQCGVNLPLDMLRQLKLLYVFNYDVKNNVLSCRKSN